MGGRGAKSSTRTIGDKIYLGAWKRINLFL